MNFRNYRKEAVYILKCIVIGVYGTMIMFALVVQFA